MILSKIRELFQWKKKTKKTRDIFRFNGEKDISLNLEHVTCICTEGKRLTFQFYATSTYVDFEDEVCAQRALGQILTIWSE